MISCEHCNTKMKGLINYKCKCDYKILCNKCRLPETHNCKYDFKLEGKTILKNNNPKIIAEKITNL